jgi:hypothetical protein
MSEEKLSENQKIELVNQLLLIKREKELYKFAIELKPDVAVDLIYLLPKKKVKYACFIVFALCDYYGKINKEEPLLYLVTLLADRAKRDKKFTKAINATLAFVAQDQNKTRKLDTSDFNQEEEDDIQRRKDSEEASKKASRTPEVPPGSPEEL